MSFASNLKSKLNEKELKPVDLAKGIGKHKSSISQYLSGSNIPQDKTKELIAQFLECTVEELDAEVDEEIEIESENNVPVWKAAKLLGKSEEFIRVSLQMGTAPFGFAAKNKSKWSYHISPKKLKEYIGEY